MAEWLLQAIFRWREKNTYAEIYNFVENENRYVWEKGSTWDNWNAFEVDEGLTPDDVFIQEFRNACIANGIEFVQAEYRKLPIVHNNKTYNVIFDINKTEVEFADAPVIDNYKIIVETQGERKIMLFEVDTRSELFNVFPVGWFLSPFENRAFLVNITHALAGMGAYTDASFVGCDLDGGFTDVVTFTVEEATERTHQGGYIFEDEGVGAYIALTPSGNVTDFRYVSIGFYGDGLFEEQTLFERPYIAGGQSFNVAWQASNIPQRGISYMDGGQRKFFYLQEDGMDGSIHLVEFTPTAFG